MRTCVLSVLGSVVLKVLNGDSLEEKSKELRDQCLDHLEDHIHDVQAFVRGRVRQTSTLYCHSVLHILASFILYICW